MNETVKQYMREIGAKGGAAGRGDAKRRTGKQCKAAADARWAKRREARKMARRAQS